MASTDSPFTNLTDSPFMNLADYPIITDRHTLPIKRFGLNVEVQHIEHGLAHLETFVATESLYKGEHRTSCAHPYSYKVWDTWWDAFKAEKQDVFGLRWLARRWPPKKRDVHVTVFATSTRKVSREALFPTLELGPHHKELGAVIVEHIDWDGSGRAV